MWHVESGCGKHPITNQQSAILWLIIIWHQLCEVNSAMSSFYCNSDCLCLILTLQKAFVKEQSETFTGGKAVESSLKAYYKEFKKVRKVESVCAQCSWQIN